MPATIAAARHPHRLPDNRAGALPTKQARAERTRDRLLEAGQHLLEQGGFDDVSIAQIARQAGCSVGAFYLRFKDKETFFQFLLDGVVHTIQADITQALQAGHLQTLPLADTVQACVEQYIGLCRRYEGLIRTAQQQSIHHSDNWQLIRALGQWVVVQFADLVVRRFPSTDTGRLREHTSIGFQIMGGHLLNTIMNKPVILGLGSDTLAFWMREVVLHCIQVQPPGNPSPHPPLNPNPQEMTP